MMRPCKELPNKNGTTRYRELIIRLTEFEFGTGDSEALIFDVVLLFFIWIGMRKQAVRIHDEISQLCAIMTQEYATSGRVVTWSYDYDRNKSTGRYFNGMVTVTFGQAVIPQYITVAVPTQYPPAQYAPQYQYYQPAPDQIPTGQPPAYPQGQYPTQYVPQAYPVQPYPTQPYPTGPTHAAQPPAHPSYNKDEPN